MLRLFLPCRIVICISSTTHHCVKKAIKVVGISQCHVRMVDTVEGEMCVHQLEQMIAQDEEVLNCLIYIDGILLILLFIAIVVFNPFY